MALLPVTLLIALGLGVLLWFGHLERTGRSAVVVEAIAALTVVDAALYPSQNEVPAGLFHPELGALSFRPVDLAIPLAVAARLWRGRRRQAAPGMTALLWGAFLAWLLTAGVLGAYAGNDLTLVTFEGKAILYLGLAVLVAGVPLEDFLTRRLQRLLWVAAGAALVLTVTDTLGVAITAPLPLLPLAGLGQLGSDAATLFSSLGIVALALGLYARSGHGMWLVAAVPLLASPLAGDQRAAWLGLAVSLGALAAGALLARRPLRVTFAEGGFAALAVTACLLAPAAVSLAVTGDSRVPFEEQLRVTFLSPEERLTTQGRLNQLAQVRPLIAERPLFGWGLGREYVFYEPGYFEFQSINLTHNILTDLLLRAGAVGLGLFLLALGASAVAGIGAFARAHAPEVAAVALAAAAVVAGLLAKGLAESIFEKYRLAVLLGLGLGAMLSAAATARR